MKEMWTEPRIESMLQHVATAEQYTNLNVLRVVERMGVFMWRRMKEMVFRPEAALDTELTVS